MKDILIPMILSFAVAAVLGPLVIPVLRRMKFGQTERTDGVQSHLQKAGTPTMGGVLILAGLLIASAIYIPRYPKIFPVLLLTLGFGVIGFIDDYLKVVKKHPDGLLPKQKMAFQIVLTGLFLFSMVQSTDVSLGLRIPFAGGMILNIGVLVVPLMFFAVIGTVNGTNFTDGLDGLLSCVTLPVAAFFIAASLKVSGEIEPVAGAMLGALLGFLLFNHYPAKVFMGDTGSLAIGGFVAGCAYMLEMPVYIIIVGCIYLVEVLSVIIQVTYYKKTGGKRIFKMAPIHHHFELCGWSEVKVVLVFTAITAVLCALGYLAI